MMPGRVSSRASYVTTRGPGAVAGWVVLACVGLACAARKGSESEARAADDLQYLEATKRAVVAFEPLILTPSDPPKRVSLTGLSDATIRNALGNSSRCFGPVPPHGGIVPWMSRDECEDFSFMNPLERAGYFLRVRYGANGKCVSSDWYWAS